MNQLKSVIFILSMSSALFATERRIVLENNLERGLDILKSVQTADSVVTQGYWNVLPQNKTDIVVEEEGSVSVSLIPYNEDEPLKKTGTLRCVSETERFKSVVKTSGEPLVTLYTGFGTVDGYEKKREGKDCAEVGGVLMDGFEELIPCATGAAGDLCLKEPLKEIRPNPEAFLSICNLTDFDATFTAIRFFKDNEWHTQGWWKATKGNCLTAGPFPTSKPIFVMATNGTGDPAANEWGTSWTSTTGCINSKYAFDYVDSSSGACIKKQEMPGDAPEAQKFQFTQLVAAGFRGTAIFDHTKMSIVISRSSATGAWAMVKNKNEEQAKTQAKAECAESDCSDFAIAQNQCLALALGESSFEATWGKNAHKEKAQEEALQACTEMSQEPATCKIVATECP